MTNQNIIHGPEIETPIPTTLGQLLKLLLESYEDAVLLVDALTREEWTSSTILQKSIRLARWMQSKGLGPGDTISIISENCLEFVLAPFSAFLTGITLAPLNPEYTTDELQHTLNLSKPKLVFCSPNTLNRILTARGKNPFIKQIVVFGSDPRVRHSMVISLQNILEDRFLDALEHEDFESPDLDVEETVATIMCSSGTTGLPKGVMTTQKNMLTFLSLLRQISNKEMDVNSGEITLGLVPFFHSMGFMILTLSTLGGRKIVVLKKFTPRIFLQSIQDFKVNLLAVPPPIIVMLCQSPLVKEYDLSSLKEVRCGAAPISPQFIKELDQKFNLKKKVLQAYGMTETTLGVLFMPPNVYKPKSVGIIVPSMSAKVMDEAGNALGPNREGELCFKGPLIMRGYVNDKVATDNTIDKDGWLRTGDIGYYDEDKLFYIVDRLKELIKYKGYQVPPAELEAILMSHREVLDAAVVGLPDERAGELPLGFVVLKPYAKITSRALQEYVKGKVSPQKQLRGGVRVIDTIPRNPSGKILRRVLRKMAAEQKSKL